MLVLCMKYHWISGQFYVILKVKVIIVVVRVCNKLKRPYGFLNIIDIN